MSRHLRKAIPLSQRQVPTVIRERARTPLAVVLGSPAEVVNLLSVLSGVEAVCYQMDLHQAARLQEELAGADINATVLTRPDLWDLPGEFQSAVYMPARGGERELKIDMVEQAFHILRPGGAFIVWSSHQDDPFFPAQLKKVFGRPHEHRSGHDTVLWCARQGERPRRRHEVSFHARIGEGPSCSFVSRPGVFSYGRLDDGARALVEAADVRTGDRILDLGCGTGAVGILASQRAGPGAFVTFVDSNVRAIALAEQNARDNGLANFQAVASGAVELPGESRFDVVLANPPYFANSSIAHLFMVRGREWLRPEGRFYLVTRQPDAVSEVFAETFGQAQGLQLRGYTILINTNVLGEESGVD